MPTKRPMATVFGGSGFIGRYIVQELAKAGYAVTIASREPASGNAVKTSGFPGQICTVSANIRDGESVARAVQNADLVVNAVGILYNHGKQSFSAIHAQGAERVAKAAKAAGVSTLIHISALGVDRVTSSKYARTKISGEKAVLAAFPEATILRPGVVFGPEDNFLNQFGRMSVISPFLPLFGDGSTQFQPIYAADVAKAVVRTNALEDARGKIYEIGGPKTYTFKELLTYVLQQTGRRCGLLALPFGVAQFIGTLCEFLPRPPLTADQVAMLKADNVVSGNLPGLHELGLDATAMEGIAPLYLSLYHRNTPSLHEMVEQKAA